MQIPEIEKHYKENRQKLVKVMTWRAGTVEGAEDIVQTAYERAIRYRRSYDGDNFNKWFSTILNNCLREYKNEEKGYSTLETIEEESETIDCPHYDYQIMREIYELIDTKSEIQQEVLNLFFKQGYASIDIARITDYSYANCHQIIQRFRNELKMLYKE